MAESMLPSAWQQWAAPSALPLSTKLGTAVAGVVKDCVDPVARPSSCGEPKTVPGLCQLISAARTRTLAEPAPRPVPAEPWRGRCPHHQCRSRPEPTNPLARFTGCPTCKAKAARRAGGALGGRGIARAPRDRSTGSTAHAIQRRQVGSSHKPALARDTRDDRTTNKDAAAPGHRAAAGPAPQRGPAPRARLRVLEPQLQSTL